METPISLAITLDRSLCCWQCKWSVHTVHGNESVHWHEDSCGLGWLAVWLPLNVGLIRLGPSGSQSRAERISYITQTSLSSLRLHWEHGWLSHDVWLPGLGWHWQSFIPLAGDSTAWLLSLVHHYPRPHTCSTAVTPDCIMQKIQFADLIYDDE